MTGLELIKRIADGEAYGVTTPLITDSTGKKFGKSEGNALWLDPKKNSPFVIYQYFINTNDADIEKYFKLLTLAEFDTIENIITKHNVAPEQRIGQEFLAHTIVQTVFGADAARQAQLITKTLFGKEDILGQVKTWSGDDLLALHNAVSKKQSAIPGERILEVVVYAGLAESNGQAKELIKSNSIYLNEQLITDMNYTLTDNDFIQGKIALLRKGKKARGSVWKG